MTKRAELSSKTITATTNTADTPIVLCDTHGVGLCVFIYKNGLKKWKLRKCTISKNGKRTTKMYDLGEFPQISLKQARQLAANWQEQPDNNEATLEELAAVWIENEVTPYKAANTIRNTQNRLNAHILPTLGKKKANEITEKQVAELCESIEHAGKIPTARDVKDILRAIFKYGAKHGYNTNNPAADIETHNKNHKAKSHEALLDAVTIGQFLRDLQGYKQLFSRCAMEFIIYTGLRKNEAFTAEWWQIDLDNAVMTIPADKMKMGQEYKTPLSRQAVAILERLKKFGTRGYIFKGTQKQGGYINVNATKYCIKSLGYTGEGKPKVTTHGWRSTLSTTLNENGFISDIIEKQLAHKAQGVRAIYNRADYWEQRKATAQWYADYLDSLRDGTPKPQLPKGCTLTGE